MRVFGVVLLLSVVLAMPALAQHGAAHLMWSDCASGGTNARTFACTTNSGTDALILSFQPANAADSIYRFETALTIGDLDFSVLPDWWSFVPVTGCRRASLTSSASFTSVSGACEDPWMGRGFSLATVTPQYVNDAGVHQLRVNVVVDIPYSAAVPLDPATEYFAARLAINHQKTVGAGSCAGCAQSMCISISTGASYTVANPANPTRSPLWSDHGSSVVWNGITSCERFVPVRNATWGTIKSLYR